MSWQQSRALRVALGITAILIVCLLVSIVLRGSQQDICPYKVVSVNTIDECAEAMRIDLLPENTLFIAGHRRSAFSDVEWDVNVDSSLEVPGLESALQHGNIWTALCREGECSDTQGALDPSYMWISDMASGEDGAIYIVGRGYWDAADQEELEAGVDATRRQDHGGFIGRFTKQCELAWLQGLSKYGASDCRAVTVSAKGHLVVGGSTDFGPLKSPGAVLEYQGGLGDAYVMELDP